jgi:hypothetical protein
MGIAATSNSALFHANMEMMEVELKLEELVGNLEGLRKMAAEENSSSVCENQTPQVKVGDNANPEVKLQDNTPQDEETALPHASGTLPTAPMAPVRKRSAVATVHGWASYQIFNCHVQC